MVPCWICGGLKLIRLLGTGATLDGTEVGELAPGVAVAAGIGTDVALGGGTTIGIGVGLGATTIGIGVGLGGGGCGVGEGGTGVGEGGTGVAVGAASEVTGLEGSSVGRGVATDAAPGEDEESSLLQAVSTRAAARRTNKVAKRAAGSRDIRAL